VTMRLGLPTTRGTRTYGASAIGARFGNENDRPLAEAHDRFADVGQPGAAADGWRADDEQRGAGPFERRLERLVASVHDVAAKTVREHGRVLPGRRTFEWRGRGDQDAPEHLGRRPRLPPPVGHPQGARRFAQYPLRP